MYRCTPNLDSHRGVQPHHSRLKRFQSKVLIREHAILWQTSFRVQVDDAKCDSGGEVVLVWTEPGVALGLFEDVVEERVVAVVVHLGVFLGGGGGGRDKGVVLVGGWVGSDGSTRCPRWGGRRDEGREKGGGNERVRTATLARLGERETGDDKAFCSLFIHDQYFWNS